MRRQIGNLFAVVAVGIVGMLAVSAAASASGGGPGPCVPPAREIIGMDRFHSPCAQRAAVRGREATGNSNGAIAGGVVLLTLAVTSGLFVATRRREQ